MCFDFIWFDATHNFSMCDLFVVNSTSWFGMKKSVGAFYGPDNLVKLPQFIGKISLPGEFYVSCYEVSIFLRHLGYTVDEGIGLYDCDDIFGQRNFPVCVQE